MGNDLSEPILPNSAPCEMLEKRHLMLLVSERGKQMVFKLHSPFPLVAHDSDGARLGDSRIINSGTPGFLLMMRAARAAVSRLVAEMKNRPEMMPDKRKPVIILAGPGNNGGDGYGVAALLKLADIDVRVLAFGRSSGDAAEAHRLAAAVGVPIRDWAGKLPKATYYIDALLGTGLSRALHGDMAAAINAVGKNKNAFILSLDVPSGLDATRGLAFKPCIGADVTISFLALKQGLLIGDGPGCAGQLYFDDLGFPPDKSLASATILSRRDCTLPVPTDGLHKGNRGSVLLLGSMKNAGLAALRAGSGKVYWTSPGKLGDHPPQLVRCAASAISSQYKNMQVIIAGAGLRKNHHDWLQMLWRGNKPMVLNATALRWLSATMAKKRRAAFIAIIHPDEAAVLLGDKPDDHFKTLQVLQSRFNGIWILTGTGTLISGRGRAVICPFAHSAFGMTGAHHVLAGILAGLWSSASSVNALKIARAGVYIYAQAAMVALEEKRGSGLVADDLVDHIGLAMKLSCSA